MSAVALLPGMNCSAGLWDGCGLDEALRVELDVPDLDGQLDALEMLLPERVVLVGVSLGAIVAMAFAIRAPDRVAALVLAATNAKAPTPAQRDGWAEWSRRLDAGATSAELQSGILPLLLSPAARRDDPGLDERAVGIAVPEPMLRAQLALQSTRRDLRPGLADVRAPALVVSGAEDALCPPAFHAEIAEALPASRVVSLDSGHLVPLERPEPFGALVRDWAADFGR